jgi:hypothetical protein
VLKIINIVQVVVNDVLNLIRHKHSHHSTHSENHSDVDRKNSEGRCTRYEEDSLIAVIQNFRETSNHLHQNMDQRQ